MESKFEQEAIKIIVKYCDKYKNNYQKSAKEISKKLTRYTSQPWNVVVGESFGLDFDYDPCTLLHLFYGPSTAICIWQSH
ncbi:hypothetical protein FO519_007349 [Halicephalobus sp. NKZ332]|nr:hypothetical protein FO519_007349 [Halicephalobus sp. NKZ332]